MHDATLFWRPYRSDVSLALLAGGRSVRLGEDKIFAPFNGTEAYFSLPSGHAVTAAALAVGVAAIWPRMRIVMAVYALAILMTRLVLLAHHPSDVVAGAVIGAAGALLLRYWFAARRLGFVIDPQGKIGPA